MWAYVFRRLIYNVPVYLGILFLVMVMLRVRDPVYAYLGKNSTPAQMSEMRHEMGLDKPLFTQYGELLWSIVRFDFQKESWEHRGMSVGQKIRMAIIPSLAITLPALVITTILSVGVGMISAYFRGRTTDRVMVIGAVVGMSVSFLVYIILGQKFGTLWLREQTGIGSGRTTACCP